MSRRQILVSFGSLLAPAKEIARRTALASRPARASTTQGCVTDGELIALIRRSNPSKMRAADVRAEFAAVYTAESVSKGPIPRHTSSPVRHVAKRRSGRRLILVATATSYEAVTPPGCSGRLSAPSGWVAVVVP